MAWNFNLYTEPLSPNGLNSWFTVEPEVYVEFTDDSDLISNATVYLAVGGEVMGRTAIATTSVLLPADGSPQQVVAATVTNIYNRRDSNGDTLYVYADKVNTFNSADLQMVPISFTTDAPSYSGFSLEAETTATIATVGPDSTKIPPVGLVNISTAAGHSFFTPTGGRVRTLLKDVVVYANSSPWLKVELNQAAEGTLPSFSPQVYTHTGSTWQSVQGKTALVFESDTQADGFDIWIPYEAKSKKNLSSLYVELVSTAGVTTLTSPIYVVNVTSYPALERVTVSKPKKAEESLSSSVEIVGSVRYEGTPTGVEWTKRRRVPLLQASFNGSLESKDYKGPTARAGVFDYVSGPDGSLAVKITSNNRLAYSSADINVNEGSLGLWFKPAGWASSQVSSKYIIDFHLWDNEAWNHDRMNIIGWFNQTTGTWFFRFGIYDSFGDPHTAVVDSGLTDANINSGFRHLKAAWKTNSVDDSRISFSFDGIQSPNNQIPANGAITFGLMPKWDMSSITAAEEYRATTKKFSDLMVGSTTMYQAHAVGSYCNLLVTDVFEGPQDSEYTGGLDKGFTIEGVTFNSFTGMFSISIPVTDNQIDVVKIRPAGIAGYTPPWAYFNTTSCKPVLVSGDISGLVDHTERVYRMQLIDSSGKFDDLKFELNPKSYGHTTNNDFIQQVSSVSGKRVLSVSPASANGRTFDWSNIRRGFMQEIVSRCESGSTFFLIDHNQEVLLGKLQLTSLEAIVGTNPSRYNVAVEFIGEGGRYDYEMG